MKFFSFLLMTVILAMFAGCNTRKPAYSNIQVEQAQKGTTQNNNAQPPPDASTASAEGAAQPPQPAAPEPFKMPTFVDPSTGTIKDLPSYPGGIRTNASFGPMQGVATAMLILQARDPVEKIAAFYEKAVKSNGWTVVDTSKDSEQAKWELKKGDRDEALIRIQKDANTGAVNIVLSRIEKPAEPKQ